MLQCTEYLRFLFYLAAFHAAYTLPDCTKRILPIRPLSHLTVTAPPKGEPLRPARRYRAVPKGVSSTDQLTHAEEAALPPIPSGPHGVTNIDQLAHVLSAATRRRLAAGRVIFLYFLCN